MKVANVMQAVVTTTTKDAPMKEVGRSIFSLGLSGIPVVDGTKIIGIVTEKDILSRIYPSIEELMDDYIHLRDFEKMEKRMSEMLNTPVAEIMNRKPTIISPDDPIMKAQSLMLINNFSHLPVVDKNKNLIGIVSQGDIFRRLIRSEIPRLEREKYADFIETHFDSMIDWNERKKREISAISTLFNKKSVKNVLELGVWTGEYTVELAKTGKYHILGIDHNPTMINLCNRKREKLSAKNKKLLKFLLTDYKNFSSINEKYDAVISVGNGLAYIPESPNRVLSSIAKKMSDKSIIILQVLNFEKILENKGRLLRFEITGSKKEQEKKDLYIEFFEKKDSKTLIHNLIFFANDGKNWLYKGITSMEINYINETILKNALIKVGFKKISFNSGMGKYKGDYYELDFAKKFDKKESDWLIVVAEKK